MVFNIRLHGGHLGSLDISWMSYSNFSMGLGIYLGAHGFCLGFHTPNRRLAILAWRLQIWFIIRQQMKKIDKAFSGKAST